jgi:DNA polymerase III alpha subunit
VIQAVALIRPGPAAAGMKERFARRARGLEPVTAPHPLLEPLFRETFGVMLYQEDVIRAAMAVAGVDAAAGDVLRRHLSKVRGGDPAQQDAFVVAGLRAGIPPAAAREVWEAMARFAAFSFCKAHAVTYGRLAYECVWLKAHHPAAFLAAMLGNDAGYYEKGVYVEEAKRHGVRMLRPCVHRSAERFALEDLPDGRPAIRVPLCEVRGLGAATVQAIHEARRIGGPFRTLADFLRRSHCARDEAEHLAQCGALDDLGCTRPQLLLALRAPPRAPAAGGPELIRGALEPRELPLPPLPEYPPEKRAALELAVLGYTLDAHPVDVLFDAPAQRGVVPLGDAPAHEGRTITVHGWVVAERRLRTSAGAPMMFVTLEDGTGVLEAALFPDAYRRLAADLQGRGPFTLRGRVESQLGGVSLRVAALWAPGRP